MTTIDTAADLTTRWHARIDSGEAFTREDMLDDYRALDAITPAEMWGLWNGGKFDGGAMEDPINWYGKRFNDFESVDPLMVTGSDGVVKPFNGLGSARLREMVYEGKVSSAIIYNQHPIFDYFRKIDDDTIIGWGEVAGDEANSFFFWLKRDK